MTEFVLMLTHDDVTVPDARAAYEEVRGAGLRYVGFKDIGATPKQLRAITTAAHEDGVEVMLEVVSLTADDEMRSIDAGIAVGVDWVLGGTHADRAVDLFRGTGIRYCPFTGTISGHPSVLNGSVSGIAEHARALSDLDGVSGLDLLVYRHPTADPSELTRAVVDAVTGPVIAAGSVHSEDQIRLLARAGAWGFTIGSAIFEGRFLGGPAIRPQVTRVLDVAARCTTTP
jgi:hypothetical protein